MTQLSSVEPHVFEALFVSGGAAQLGRPALAVGSGGARIRPTRSRRHNATRVSAGRRRRRDSCPRIRGRLPSPAPAQLGTAAAATIRAAWIRRLAPERRVLFVQLDTTGPDRGGHPAALRREATCSDASCRPQTDARRFRYRSPTRSLAVRPTPRPIHRHDPEAGTSPRGRSPCPASSLARERAGRLSSPV